MSIQCLLFIMLIILGNIFGFLSLIRYARMGSLIC